jgi:hypothetical protein
VMLLVRCMSLFMALSVISLDAEFGPLSPHIGHRVAIKLDYGYAPSLKYRELEKPVVAFGRARADFKPPVVLAGPARVRFAAIGCAARPIRDRTGRASGRT